MTTGVQRFYYALSTPALCSDSYKTKGSFFLRHTSVDHLVETEVNCKADSTHTYLGNRQNKRRAHPTIYIIKYTDVNRREGTKLG